MSVIIIIGGGGKAAINALVWAFVAKIDVDEPDEHSKYPGIG